MPSKDTKVTVPADGTPWAKIGSWSTSKNVSDVARDTSWPVASSVTVSSLPFSQIAETRFGPPGIASTQPAVSISPTTVFFCTSTTPSDAAGVT